MKPFLLAITLMGSPVMSSVAFAGGDMCVEIKVQYCLPF